MKKIRRALTPITSNEDLVSILELQCSKTTDQYFPLHEREIHLLKAATTLVNIDKSTIRRNPQKLRATTILTDLWTYAKEAYILCALATSQSSLGALKTTDYVKAVQTWWEQRPVKPRSLAEIIHLYSHILPPTTRGNSDFVAIPTTVANLTEFIRREHGDAPLIITCPFGGMPAPFMQIGQGPKIKIELSMEAFMELTKANEGL